MNKTTSRIIEGERTYRELLLDELYWRMINIDDILDQNFKCICKNLAKIDRQLQLAEHYINQLDMIIFNCQSDAVDAEHVTPIVCCETCGQNDSIIIVE